MRKQLLVAALIISGIVILTACSKQADNNAPLAFVPADTPYVIANIDPIPKEIVDQWTTRMQPFFKLYGASLESLLDEAKPTDDLPTKVAHAVVEEIKSHDSLEKWTELGYKPNGHAALYGIGLVPVFRLELSNSTGLKAAIARIEAKVGQKLPSAKIGEQEYWQLGNEKLQGIFALQGDQLVLSLMPNNASEDLRKQLLGITRPTKSLQDSGGLAALNKQYHYLANGSGYIDIRHITALIAGEHTGAEREFAIALGLPPQSSDPICVKELDALTARFPRIVTGYRELNAQRFAFSTKLELDPLLAKDLLSTIGPVPGMGENDKGLLDFAISLPLLKVKDFWLKQAQAVVDKPFQCPSLTELNQGFGKFKERIDQTIPAPASNFLGFRFLLSRFAFKTGMKPDFSGKVLIAADNPTMLTGMAQMFVPAFKDLKLTNDGKPTALPTGAVPGDVGPMSIAVQDKAIAISVGEGEAEGLSAFLNTPAAKQPTFMHMGYDGAIYETYAQVFDQVGALLPNQKPTEMEAQKQMMRSYKEFIKRADIYFVYLPDGVEIQQTLELK